MPDHCGVVGFVLSMELLAWFYTELLLYLHFRLFKPSLQPFRHCDMNVRRF
uniref:Uncharacterized protein n=1 Tax=Arundo donax TaxID=35708 RepID=A0A0A9EYI9_ARUDO